LKRIGLIIPSVNTVLEHDLRLFLPDRARAHVTRIRLVGTTREQLLRALEAVPGAAQLLGDAGVDAVGLACTGASMLGGAGGERALSAQIAAAAGVPATNTVEALLDAFDVLRVRRIGLFSPFDDRFNAEEAAILEAAGVAVVRTVGLSIADPRRCADIPPGTIADRARAADHPEAEALFLSCANLRGLEAAEILEQAAGKPVVTSNGAMLWAMLRLARIDGRIGGAGCLFDKREEVA